MIAHEPVRAACSTSATESVASGARHAGQGHGRRRLQPAQRPRARTWSRPASPSPRARPRPCACSAPTARRSRRSSPGADGARGPLPGHACRRSATRSTTCRRPTRGARPRSALKVTSSSLENARYRVRVDAERRRAEHLRQDDQARAALARPRGWPSRPRSPRDWPAWNMDWADRQKPPRAYVAGPGPGPRRGERARRASPSRSRARPKARSSCRPSACPRATPGERVEIANVIDWRTQEAALKATFPLTAANPEATYNWDMGTIRRGNNDAEEVRGALAPVVRPHRQGRRPRRDRALRLQVRLGQARRPHAAPDAALHARPGRGQRPRLQRPAHPGLGPPRVRLRPGRPRRRLAPRGDRLAGLSPQPAAAWPSRARNTRACWARSFSLLKVSQHAACACWRSRRPRTATR